MRHFSGFEAAAGEVDGAALALGTFDGLHRGHQALIGAAIGWARAHDRLSVVVTFDPPPVAVLAPHLFRAPLLSLAQKLDCLAALGADAVVVQPFDRAFADREALAFVEDDLIAALAPSAIFVGENFNFGRGRVGNAAMLRAIAANRGVELFTPLLVQENAIIISSTEIRRQLDQGDVATASRLLGRLYAIEGTIQHGRARGRCMGFPTANLDASGRFLPLGGVYAARARVDEELFQPAVVNIGTKPTFGERDTTVEAFLLDETRELYGRTLCLEFIARLRAEEHFDSTAALCQQIELDCRRAREILEALSS
ncbi:MAG: bifunctional riboflavin kinase/FAD synthetase [Myxococcales bacterium]|jgi:riboflavin kinase/FMN adenylyltransferase|nr:bifunctional riboflavin kinase/FAD synthetase [Myxococcales bacterium]